MDVDFHIPQAKTEEKLQLTFLVVVGHQLVDNLADFGSARELTSIDNLEDSLFNPLEKGGGPRWTISEKYRSGLIAVPPV